MIISAANHLDNNKKIVDELNVFPVPDGDTGTNMSLTLLAAAKEVESKEETKISDIADCIASSTLRGARGNSGVILSQWFRGFAKALKQYDFMDGKLFAEALQTGVDTAYKAVMKPTEGTILTVAREGALKAVQVSKVSENIIEIFEQAIIHAKEILDKTPDMLPVLKQAGVVDAGGKGLIYILEGAFEAIKSGEIIRIKEEKSSATVKNPSHSIVTEIEFAYCTEFLINKDKSVRGKTGIANQFKTAIIHEGDSMLVIDDDEVIKVHIHTNNPGKVIQEALKLGELTNIKIDNMKEQHGHILAEEEKECKEYGIISVAVGDGIVEILKDLGVDEVIEGGQTMNPSTDDILQAIDKVNANNIYILPNNKNIILAAEQAKELSDKNVIVVPSKSIPHGIAAMLAFDITSEANENHNRMIKALENVNTGNITYAVRNTTIDDRQIQEGDILGIKNGEIFTVGKSAYDVCKELIEGLMNEDSLMVTMFYGHDVNEEEAQKILDYVEEKFPECDVEVHNGGQPLYHYIISVE